MDDREIVAAIAAGDPTGLADAYDQYAEALYGYCHLLTGDPDDAADSVQDAFVVAVARIGGLRDPRRLRPWLYALARNECHRRLDPEKPATFGAADSSGLAGPLDEGELAELRRLVQAALDGLGPGEHEAVELGLRHDLPGADLAAVLGLPRNRAYALAASGRDHLEKALGVLLVARTGRRDCAALDLLLEDWDGRLTVLMRKRIGRHIDQCDTCAARRRGKLRPAALYGMPPLAAPPYELREDVLGLCSDESPVARSYRQEVAERADPIGPSGFPRAIRPPRPRLFALSGAVAAVGVVIAIAATGVVTVFALSGSHPPPSADAARAGTASATASATASTDLGGGTIPSVLPSISQPALTSAPPAVATSAAAATSAAPSPARSATSSAASAPSPSASSSSATPRPSRTGFPSPTPGGPTSTPSFPT